MMINLFPSTESWAAPVLKHDSHVAVVPALLMSGLRLLPPVRLVKLVIKFVAAHCGAVGAGALIVTFGSSNKFGV